VIVAVLYVRIPEDRIGALIGPGGSTKRRLEERTRTHVTIDPSDGQVEVVAPDDGDPIGLLKARDFALAVGRGFSPARAERLLRDDTYLGVVDIRAVSGKREKSGLWRVRSRLIGSDGRARTRIEDLSGCSMSVYGSTVALIGQERQLERATKAIELLLHGSEHATVFHMLARQRRDDARDDATGPLEVPDAE
jgi:ribosomal RNA assembly protein